MRIDKLTRIEAIALYKTASKAMKCDTTGVVTFEVNVVGKTKLVIANNKLDHYSMTNRDEWNEDLFTSPETTYRHTILK